MCLTFSDFVLLIFSMTIKAGSNERGGLFAYCNLFCIDCFNMKSHLTRPVHWETCASWGRREELLRHCPSTSTWVQTKAWLAAASGWVSVV